LFQEDRAAANAEHSSAADELQRRRLELADLNRKVAALQRRIDEVPSQTELNQYQQRFLELYNQGGIRIDLLLIHYPFFFNDFVKPPSLSCSYRSHCT
jgi:hypothetical protein